MNEIDVVIGGRGFLGSSLARRLSATGRPARIVTRDAKTAAMGSLLPGVEVVQGDLEATKTLPVLLLGARAVYFSVPISGLAEAPGDWNPLPFLAACAELGVHLIVPIDISLYRCDGNPPYDEKAELIGRGSLGEAQLEWENAALLEGLRRRFAVTVVRLPPLLGEGLKAEEIREAIARARTARPIEILGRGDEVVERVHVDDAARACSLVAGKRETAGEILHIAGHPIRRRNFFRILVKVAESKAEVVSLDMPEVPRRKRRDFPDPPRDFWVRGEKSRRMIGYAPEISYERALRESLATPLARDAASA